MAMDLNAWNDLSRQIVAAAGDQAALTSLVTQATNEYSEVFAEHASFEKERNDLKADNEALRQANMDLFLQLTQQKKAAGGPAETPQDEGEKITIKDLFKGE